MTYNIEIPFSAIELEQLLHGDREFDWTFVANEDANVFVSVNIVKED
jgi:hypothetical protein